MGLRRLHTQSKFLSLRFLHRAIVIAGSALPGAFPLGQGYGASKATGPGLAF